MAYKNPRQARPQQNYVRQRNQLAAYQYRNMNRYRPTQIKRWDSSAGNAYGIEKWRKVDPERQAAQYWQHRTMQRIGGDMSLEQRMYGGYGGEGWEGNERIRRAEANRDDYWARVKLADENRYKPISFSEAFEKYPEQRGELWRYYAEQLQKQLNVYIDPNKLPAKYTKR